MHQLLHHLRTPVSQSLDELPDTRNAENEASRSVKEPVAEFSDQRQTSALRTDHRHPSCTIVYVIHCTEEAPGLQ